MTLTPGSRPGPYEIVAPLGAGGMGEIYRARDPRLGREVAIKGLPPAFSQDVERLTRFDREAKLLASLSHPNIGVLYGLEEPHFEDPSADTADLVGSSFQGPTCWHFGCGQDGC